MIYWILRMACAPLLGLLWVGRVRHKNLVPKEGGCIIAANHASFLDFILLFAIVPRRMTFLAAEKFFTHPLWRLIMAGTGQIRVNRDSPDKEQVYREVGRLLSSGGCLGIFPEGTRSRDGTIHKAYNGVAKFSKKYDVPVIPVGIKGAFKAWSPSMKFPRFSKVDFIFGDPTRIETDDAEAETQKIMKKIATLAEMPYDY